MRFSSKKLSLAEGECDMNFSIEGSVQISHPILLKRGLILPSLGGWDGIDGSTRAPLSRQEQWTEQAALLSGEWAGK